MKKPEFAFPVPEHETCSNVEHCHFWSCDNHPEYSPLSSCKLNCPTGDNVPIGTLSPPLVTWD